MRKYRFIAILAFAALITASCYTDIESELASLERRVSNLDQRLATINSNIESLNALADKYKSYIYVLSYTPIYSGKEVTGYKINLSDGSSITLNNGVSKDDPIVGLQLDDDGLYYWIVTVNGVTDYFYDDVGQKIAASVASPIMKIENDVWMVSFDNGYIWQTFDRARGADGYSYVDSIVTRGDYIQIYLVSGQTVSFPSYTLYENYVAQLGALNANMASLQAIYDAKLNSVYVKSVVPIVKDGENVGYSMVFSDGTSIEVYHGKRYEGEEIGLVQYTDGEYYWAVSKDGKSEWLYDDLGNMVQGSPIKGQSPIFMLEEGGDGKYYWCYKYGESGYKFSLYDKNGKKVAASNSGVVQVFSSVTVADNYVLFTPLSGDPFYLPRYKVFTVQFNKTTVTVPSTGVEITYGVKDVPSTVAITAITDQGYHAHLTKSYNADTQTLTGTIKVTADASAAATSTMLVLVSDGDGHMETFNIELKKQ